MPRYLNYWWYLPRARKRIRFPDHRSIPWIGSECPNGCLSNTQISSYLRIGRCQEPLNSIKIFIPVKKPFPTPSPLTIKKTFNFTYNDLILCFLKISSSSESVARTFPF